MIFIVLILSLIIAMSMLDDKIVKEYSPLFSFCKELDRKMLHFPDKGATWFKIYMNIVLPCSVWVGVMRAWNSYQNFPLLSFQFIISAAFALIVFTNCLTFREIDRFAYYFNIFETLYFLGLLIYENISTLAFNIIGVVLWIACAAISLSYFYRKRELFLLTTKELAEKYTYI